jgi:3-hydroxy-D-aspartate aldolase
MKQPGAPGSLAGPNPGPNAGMIGRAGSRQLLATPCLVLDLDALEHNVAALAAHAREHGYALRPVAKIHKSAAIARLQLAAGALGQSCATLTEAEVMVDAGIRGVLLFSSVVSRAKLERLVALNARADGLLVAVDDAANVAAMAALNPPGAPPLKLLVDCEVGGGRTGVADPAAAVALARRIAATAGVTCAGIQVYCGRIQQIAAHAARQAAAREVATRAQAYVDALCAAGLPPAIVSGGGTGTYAIDAAFGVQTECQAGSYVFMDANYLDVELEPGGPPRFRPALFVRTTVISAAQAGFCITDAGRKEFARDGLAPRPWTGAPAGARYSIVGDDLGRIDFAAPGQALPLGATVECLAPHAYATLNLYPVYHCVRGDTLVDIWPIDARLNW